MEKVINFWVDGNGNRWDCALYTESEAEKASRSLENCSYCVNCVECSNCIHCRNCFGCRNCSACGDCVNCVNCRFCSDCKDCSFCRCVQNCRKQPEIYYSKQIDGVVAYFYRKSRVIYVSCGDFHGTIERFEEKFGNEFGEEIEKVRRLWS